MYILYIYICMFVCAFVCVRVSVFLRVCVNSTMVGTKFKTSSLCGHWGPSISNVHTEGVRLRWTHVDGGRGLAPCGRPHRKLKLESTEVILSSSHAKKLASFLPEFRLWTEESEHFSAI